VLEQKVQVKQNLDVSDLVFLYEINAKIEGFGYEPDVRITELRSKRNPEEDMPIVFGCEKSQIARSVSQIRPDTKAYVGKLVPGLFDLLQQSKIEHVYTSFPEGKIRKEKNGIGDSARNLSVHFDQFRLSFKKMERKLRGGKIARSFFDRLLR